MLFSKEYVQCEIFHNSVMEYDMITPDKYSEMLFILHIIGVCSYLSFWVTFSEV